MGGGYLLLKVSALKLLGGGSLIKGECQVYKRCNLECVPSSCCGLKELKE